MIRVLFASWYTGLGGGEADLLTLAKALDRSRYEPHLLAPAQGSLPDRWRETGLPVHILPYRGASTWFIPAVWARFPVVQRMTELLRRQKIDLVQSDYHTLPLIAGAARKAGIPASWTVWGWWFKPKPWQRSFFPAVWPGGGPFACDTRWFSRGTAVHAGRADAGGLCRRRQ